MDVPGEHEANALARCRHLLDEVRPAALERAVARIHAEYRIGALLLRRPDGIQRMTVPLPGLAVTGFRRIADVTARLGAGRIPLHPAEQLVVRPVGPRSDGRRVHANNLG